MNAIARDSTDAIGVSDKEMANALRFIAADAVQRAESGHPGMPMGMADVATVLFTRFLKFNPADPEWQDRDRFVLSAGHGSMLLYGLLHLTGYEHVTLEEIRNFRQLGSTTAGHPEYGHMPGVETTTGPLGQGITTAVGMAIAERLQQDRFDETLVDHYTYVIAGDGCLMEGISQEAISMAGHLKLNKLIVLWDDNSISIDGSTDLSVSDDQTKRFDASGWAVDAVDGHDPEAIAAAIRKAKGNDRPTMIACRTVIGFGSPNKAGTSSTHGSPLGVDEIAASREHLDWPHEPFVIPEAIGNAWLATGKRSLPDYEAWQDRLKQAQQDVREEFLRTSAGALPVGWQADLDTYKRELAADQPALATRKASGAALKVLTHSIGELIGGSADLTGSVNTKTPDTDAIGPDDFSGRYIHYGVREHAMAAVMNGIALHGGFIPYGGTFLVFADYMRGAMRLSALMGQRVIYVLTHDSIGLGEDGPTHQPVETLAMLRATPNFNVYRPADAMETAECWELALDDRNTPSGIALSRQTLPALRKEYSEENLSARGAYVLADADKAPRKVTLLATGSEVSLAMAARGILEGQGIGTAVVSMPCWERFEQQDADYKAAVLGPDTVRVGVEAAVGFGWDRYVGERGTFIGMQSFGASAPAAQLYEHFGITAEAIVGAATAQLDNRG
ncbi:MAG: transketolase [Gammaproteobacteria bacterium]|nr:transketolase [Gammaproteobacteria bacterium]